MFFYTKLFSYKDEKKIRSEIDPSLYSEVIIDEQRIQKEGDSVYEKMKQRLLDSDRILVIDSLSSLGKDSREICKELRWIGENNVRLCVLDLPSTKKETASPEQLLSEVFEYLAERERRTVKAAQKIGIDQLQKENREYGRKRIPYPEGWALEYARWRNGDITAVEFMKNTGLKKSTFYNLLKQYTSQEQEDVLSGS